MKNRIIKFIVFNHHTIIISGSILSFITILLVGAIINLPVLFGWNVAIVNYFVSKLAELSAGFIISAIFYYIVVWIPERRKYGVVKSRIAYLIQCAEASENRVLNTIIKFVKYDKEYNNLNSSDFETLFIKLDELLITNRPEVEELSLYMHRHTLKIEDYLHKVLGYYGVYLSIEALRSIEELLESLHFTNIKNLAERIEVWVPGREKFVNLYENYYDFDARIRRLSSFI